MSLKKNQTRAALSALLVSLLLVACSEKPEAMLSSAKDYLTKNDNKAAVIQIKNALQKNPDMPEARFMLGKTLLDSGDAAGAETELRKALALNYPQDPIVPLLANAMLAQGQAKKLTDEFGKTTLTDKPAQGAFLTSLATAYAAQGQAKPAQASLDAALAATPDYAPAKLIQARQKGGQRDFDAALALTEEVIASAPQNFEAWKLKGDLLRYAKDQPTEALAAYRKSVEIKPEFLAGQAALITLLFQQNNFADATTQLEQLKKFNPNHPQTKFLQAHLAYQQKDLKGARDLVQQVLKAVPGNVQALQLAGAVELQLNSPIQAEAYLSKALQAAPGLPLARRLLVTVYLRTGQAAKALATLTPGLSADNVDPALYALAGEVYLQNNDLKKAEEYFTKATQQDPQNARSRTSLALTRLVGGQVDSAFGELENIAASDAGTTADMALISAHLRRQELDKALQAIDGLEKKQPDKPLAANLRGRVLLAKKDVAGARKSFERALQVDALYFPAVASLAGLDLADNKPADAKARFDAVLAKDPKNSQALLALAELSLRTGGSKEDVIKLLDHAVTANPTEVAPRILLIDYYLRNKDFKQATSAAQNATATLPENPDILGALGRAQQASGEFNQALASYNKLSALQPMSPMPYLFMADVHMAMKDKTAAANSLRKALELKPDLQQAQRGSILLDMDGKNIQGALATAKTMQKQDPKGAVGYVLEGDINASQKNWDSAANAYRDGLKQVSSPELAIKLHSVLLAANKPGDADRLATTWQRDNPKDAAFVLYLGDGAINRKDYASAEKLYSTVIKVQPNNAVAYNNLAWVSARLNRDSAIALAEKANTLAPNQPAFMDTLAVLLSDKGDYAKAAELQTKAVALQPQNPVFKLNLAKIHIKGGKKELAKVQLDELAALGDKFGGQKEVAELLKTP
ncbi:XrtA/PEP-CTERM system TPR-repeat protein PrsT [Rhodoferax antarcticus]|uniref:XrtA/PEP-CTERM system TPR-repeat protein PrsT n=1 Tax=Rhodoferax antarcticus TaxID=81479 RepID=UPI002225A818|nr:XrtA/PEP-CTERM system TPR-repeat protein PrsT [Rhodoferax antarcticus]MCW2313575.1 putative PEP-CTERM system TPR-repeat lipoprotein [Rhodoferax antarcticus]